MKTGSGIATLYVVGTPIGNLGDVSSRVRDTLAQADILLCEDTRVTLHLLHSLGIQPPRRIERCDAHSVTSQFAYWAREIQEKGATAVYVSDAGTPGVSDPVAELVRACQSQGVRISAVPGPSALSSVISISGMVAATHVFHGFFPRETAGKLSWWERVEGPEAGRAHYFFESPHRIEESLQWLSDFLPQVDLVLVKELTKSFERRWAGKCQEVVKEVFEEARLDAALLKGEWVFGLQWERDHSRQQSSASSAEEIPEEIQKVCEVLLRRGVKASQLAKFLAQNLSLDRNTVYRHLTEEN